VKSAGIDPPLSDAAVKSLELRVPAGRIAAFFPLLQTGVTVPADVGCSLKCLLCDQLGIDAEFVARRILTIFCDSHPVDDLDRTIVRDGSRIALSAAMPGLVGASMRRGGQYAALRRGISHGADADTAARGSGTVQIKIFNLLLAELGPLLLSRGVLLERDDLMELLPRLSAVGQTAPAGADRVLLTVTFGESGA
jgi:hypothetical protein